MINAVTAVLNKGLPKRLLKPVAFTGPITGVALHGNSRVVVERIMNKLYSQVGQIGIGEFLWRHVSWLGIWVGFVAAVASIVGLLFSIQTTRTRDVTDSVARNEVVKLQEMTNREAELSRTKVQFLEEELRKTKEELARLTALTTVPSNKGAAAALVEQLARMQTAVDESTTRLDAFDKRSGNVAQRMTALEAVILAEPHKALELPLLKRDIQAFQQQFDRDINAVRAENAKAYDLMKWLLGLMALVSLSLVGTAISTVFKRE